MLLVTAVEQLPSPIAPITMLLPLIATEWPNWYTVLGYLYDASSSPSSFPSRTHVPSTRRETYAAPASNMSATTLKSPSSATLQESWYPSGSLHCATSHEHDPYPSDGGGDGGGGGGGDGAGGGGGGGDGAGGGALSQQRHVSE